jgi:hypothetical protein
VPKFVYGLTEGNKDLKDRGGWTYYARAMHDAGTAIEVNIYYIASNPRKVVTCIRGSSPAAGSAHDLAYPLDQVRYRGRHLGGQLGAEAERAADYGEDRKSVPPRRSVPIKTGRSKGWR